MISAEAKLSDFKIRRENSRVINDIERKYNVWIVDETGKKRKEKGEYSLQQVLAMRQKQEFTNEFDRDWQEIDCLRVEYMKERCEEKHKKINSKTITKFLFSSIMLAIVALAFLRFVVFSTVDIGVVLELTSYIVCPVIVVSIVYFLKYHKEIQAMKNGDNDWITVVEFYDNPKQYYRNIGSSRAVRTNNIENDYMYLHADYIGKTIHLIVSDELYKMICDLKKIPVKVYNNKLFINEFAVDVNNIKWRIG